MYDPQILNDKHQPSYKTTTVTQTFRQGDASRSHYSPSYLSACSASFALYTFSSLSDMAACSVAASIDTINCGQRLRVDGGFQHSHARQENGTATGLLRSTGLSTASRRTIQYWRWRRRRVCNSTTAALVLRYALWCAAVRALDCTKK